MHQTPNKPNTLLRCALLLSLFLPSASWSRGVTPYLPLNMSPDIERQIERVLILGDKPILRRPIAAATVIEALPKACAIDEALCQRVSDYLQRYIGDRGFTHLQGTAALTNGDSDQVIPNAHGMRADSPWNLFVSVFYQPNDFMLLNLGGLAYQGRAMPTGSLFSMGFSYAQLDIGYRDHWLSPLSDSSTLISTEAETMPSLTLSNYEPISPLGLSYEIFAAKMSPQDNIAYFGSTTSGSPRLSGLHLAMEPVDGYALSFNRVLQYGGGARSAGTSQFIDALFKNSNRPDVAGESDEFGNQVASITSSIVFPGAVPFAVRLEYAGEDNAYDRYRLGATNFSLGIDFPQLWKRYDLSYEISEWQQSWYLHHIYRQGLTNRDIVIGHWFGQARQPGDGVFGYSQSMAVGAHLSGESYLRARYRMIDNADYSSFTYERGQELALSYSTAWHGYPLSAELNVGKDVFGDAYSRLAFTFDLVADRYIGASVPSYADDEDVTEYFVDSGANYSRTFERLSWSIPMVWTDKKVGYHLGLGARRKVSARNDLGFRLEFDELAERSLISLRAVDYRFRFNRYAAVGGFFGMSRYQIFSLPAYGFYWGAGLQWTNILHGWDLGFDYRMNDKLTRTKVKPSDPIWMQGGGIYIDSRGMALYLSYRF